MKRVWQKYDGTPAQLERVFAAAAAYTEKSKIFRDKKWQNGAAREKIITNKRS